MESRRPGQSEVCVQLESSDAIVSRLAQQDKLPWYKKPNLRRLYFLMAPACLAVEMMSGFDASMINGLQAVPSWLEYYGHPHSTSLGLMASMYALGSLAALPFVPFVADKFGRRYPILLGATISTFGGVLQGSALNFLTFIMARFILGFAVVFCIVGASSLIGELSHPKERAVISCLSNVFYDIGAVTAAIATLVTFAMSSDWGWRIPSFLQVVPSLLQASFIWFIPESPRWLVSRGRRDEAYAILVKYHAEGNENSDFVVAEYTQIKETLEAELNISQVKRRKTFLTPGMRKRIVIASFLGVSMQWSGYVLVSHFLSLILDTIGFHDNRTKNIINVIKHGWSFVNCTFFALTAPRFSRRSVYLACTTSLLVVFIAFTIASAEFSMTRSLVASKLMLALIFLHSPAYNAGFSVLTYTYLIELFPFHARAGGITIFQWCSRGAGFVNLLVNPIGIETAGWKFYIVYCVWIAFEVAFVYFMFPETAGRTLEELTFLYEEDDRKNLRRNSEFEGLLEHGETDTHRALEDNRGGASRIQCTE